MRRYETFLIVDPDISQDQRDPVVDRVKELIAQQDGFLVFEDVWGERKLAYEIKKKERGYYIRFDYCGLSELVDEIERFFRIDDRVLKYMTVVLDKDVDLEKVKEEQAAAQSQREPEPEPAPQESAEKTETAEASPQKAEASSEQALETEPSVEKPAPDAAATETAEATNPVEKKEEA